jgi:hypothetical protein
VRLIGIVMTASEKFDPDTTDLIAESRKFIQRGITSMLDEITTGENIQLRLERAAARVVVKNNQPNIFAAAFLNRAAEAKRKIAMLKEDIQQHRDMLAMLDGFDYKADLSAKIGNDFDAMIAALISSSTYPRPR